MKLLYDQGVWKKEELEGYQCLLENSTRASKLNFVWTYKRINGLMNIFVETKLPVFDS